MKPITVLITIFMSAMLFCSCQTAPSPKNEEQKLAEETLVILADEKVTANGSEVGTNPENAVCTAKDIIYYQSGKDFTYGEGSEKDAHEKSEADAHTVVHIAKAGTYRLQGKLSQGQIAVDLGKDAKEDPQAVVTLILDGVDITCTVAPAVIFYNVYECGTTNEKKATKDVDTSKAGANVILADKSTNQINGSYVEKIYDPDSVELNKEKSEVKDAKKLHKYDGAFYSKMSMNVGGEKSGSGILNINAENEGLDSELHLTINGGEINIRSGNDGINTNEDGVSVTTVNGGTLSIRVTGETGEGDGIDSNGWLVINGGSVAAEACSTSGDAGIDSDLGIHINGGTVIASGSMLDRIEGGEQTYAVFNFAQKQNGGEKIKLKNQAGNIAFEAKPENAYSIMILSSPELMPGVYTLWSGETQLVGQSGGMMGGGMRPDGENPQNPNGEIPEMPEMPEGQTPPDRPDEGKEPKDKIPSDRIERPNGENPKGGFQIPEDGKMPDFNFPGGSMPDFDFPQGQMPEENIPENGFGSNSENNQDPAENSAEFVIREGANSFQGIAPLQ